MSSGTPIIDKALFRKKVERLSNLPTLPHLMEKFTRMIKDPTKSMADVGEEIGKDQTLTGKVLRLVNSAFYGFPTRIGTLTHAMVLLGYDAVKGLIVSTSVFDYIRPEAYPLWRHSLATSIAARNLADALNLQDLEEIAVAALLHDIGKVVLHIEAHDEYMLAIDYAVKENLPMWQAEREILGFDHADIGLWLCEKWLLPAKLATEIGYHHKPALAKSEKLRVSLIAAADALVRGMGGGAEENLGLHNLDSVVEDEIKLKKKNLVDLVEAVLPQIQSLKGIGPKDLC